MTCDCLEKMVTATPSGGVSVSRLADDHGFLQGNKRTAYAMLEWILAINRLGEIAAADDDVVRFCSEAENHQWSIDDIEDWLRANVEPRP